MGRLPPQLDIFRLCNAADEVVKFYRERIQKNRWTAIVQFFNYEMDELERAIMIIPRRDWQGWTDAAYDCFVNVSEKARRVASHWSEVSRHAEPNDRIVERLGNVYAGVRRHIEFAQFEFENRIDDLKESADLLRTLCQFILCEQQIDILSALAGKSRTAEQLMKSCNIPKSRLYGKRDDKTTGGLNELMRLDLVRNGSKDDSGIKGYYRPDHPPE